MKKQERTIKQKVASAHATFYTLAGFVLLALSDTHFVLALLGVFCFYVAFRYNRLSHN